jgi:hypothetical protein
MTTTTEAGATKAEAKPSAQEALAAAGATYKATQDAVDTARAAASRQALDDAEHAAARAIAAAVSGEGDRATANAARERVEQLRRDLEWAGVELQAAEQAMSRAADDAARANRAVIAQEYLAAHKTHNDPSTRVNLLLDQLTEIVSELVPLVDARDQLHYRIAQEYGLFPADEKLQIPVGRPITASPHRGAPDTPVHVPPGAIAQAIVAGIAAARH